MNFFYFISPNCYENIETFVQKSNSLDYNYHFDYVRPLIKNIRIYLQLINNNNINFFINITKNKQNNYIITNFTLKNENNFLIF